MKKFFGGLLAALLLVSPLTQAVQAEEFADPWYKYYAEDLDGHWAENDMNNMLQAGIIKGVRDAEELLYAMPNKNITRAEFTVLVVRALELSTNKQGKAFTDTVNHWAKNDIDTASALGIVSGKSDTEFKPNANISRAEIASIVYRAFDATVTFENGTPKDFSDLKSTHWAYNHVRSANQVGVIKGTSDTTVSPDKSASRAEAAAMLSRALWLEDVDLPVGEDAMNLILSNETGTVDAVNAKDSANVYALNDADRYGLAHEIGQMDAEIYEDMFAAGEDVLLEVVSQPTTEVTALSTRMVKVNVQDLVIDYYFTDPETGQLDEVPFTEDRSGTYYLIKRGGEWKIFTSDFFNNYLYFEIE